MLFVQLSLSYNHEPEQNIIKHGFSLASCSAKAVRLRRLGLKFHLLDEEESKRVVVIYRQAFNDIIGFIVRVKDKLIIQFFWTGESIRYCKWIEFSMHKFYKQAQANRDFIWFEKNFGKSVMSNEFKLPI